MANSLIFKLVFIITIVISIQQDSVVVLSQNSSIAPSPASDSCNGIFISYTHIKTKKLAPDLSKSRPTEQPYRFDSTLTILNNGLEDLKSWMVFVGFRNNELLVSASDAILADGSALPAKVGNGTVFSGFPNTDLKTAFETAGDLTQISVDIDLVGTQFGVAPPNVPLPSNISLANDGFICPVATKFGKSQLQVCCTSDPNFKSNITLDDGFLPRREGDLTIMYDVTRTYASSYLALVTIENHNPLGRLDNWKLSWDWMRDEFIFAMRGAYPSVIDTTDCVYGVQGQYYGNLDFATALNCKRRPTIVDLPLTKANDSQLGLIPYCCRNGTILPPEMDPSKSASAFQINVFKMPPDVNRSEIYPPQNFAINGTLNPDYKCGPPVRVSPTHFPDPSGLPTDTSAVASWQIVCNITTQAKGVTTPKCCVSFSSYYNDSVIPCNTCACGCSSNTTNTCSTTSPAILLPPQALLVPFENRTKLAIAYSNLKHHVIPNPMPCGDNCGVSLNWHVNADYSRGWTARVTLFNWDEINFADWFVAVQMDKAGPGFEAAYSFNATTVELNNNNNTIFMQGLPGLNYLVAEADDVNPEKNPRIPGKQQSIISFTKKKTPGIKIASGDGFPTKVFFNGEECSLPTVFPTSSSQRKSFGLMYTIILTALVFLRLDR